MIYASIALFALAAVLGVVNLTNWAKQQSPPNATVYAHGAAAATALVILIVYALQHKDHSPTTSVILFAIAALGGFYLFFKDKMKNSRPMVVAIFHGVLAVIGFVALLFFAFS